MIDTGVTDTSLVQESSLCTVWWNGCLQGYQYANTSCVQAAL